MKTEQNWETCKYSVAADGGDEMSYELKKRGLFEVYACGCKEVIESGIYPTEQIKEEDGSLTEVARLHWILIGDELSEEDVKRLKAEVEKALVGCKHCKYYRPK